MSERKNFLITNSINQGAIKILRKKKIDADLIRIEISTVGYYANGDEFFYDAYKSNLKPILNIDKNVIYYSLEGQFQLEIDTKKYNKFIKEETYDISCDFYYDGKIMDDYDDYETIETPPLIKIALQAE